MRGRRYRISASGHTGSTDLGGLSVLDNQVAVSRSCQRGSVWWRSKPQFCGGEPLYYQHRPAALWALPHLPVFEGRRWLGIRVLFLRWVSFNQLTAQRKQCGAVSRAEDAEVPDAHKARWQYVQQ